MPLLDPQTFTPIVQGGAGATILWGFLKAVVRMTTESHLKLIEHLYSEIDKKNARITSLEIEVAKLQNDEDTPPPPPAMSVRKRK